MVLSIYVYYHLVSGQLCRADNWIPVILSEMVNCTEERHLSSLKCPLNIHDHNFFMVCRNMLKPLTLAELIYEEIRYISFACASFVMKKETAKMSPKACLKAHANM